MLMKLPCAQLVREVISSSHNGLSKWAPLTTPSPSKHADIDFVSNNHIDFNARYVLRLALSRRVNKNQTFICTVLFATCTADTTISPTNKTRSSLIRTLVSSFSHFRGLEATILKMAADFTGVPYGRPLRNLREALQVILA
jgi:hypothetical protein